MFEELDYDDYIDAVVSGEKYMDDLPGEYNCLETLEKVYKKLELYSIVASEVIQANDLENKEKKLSDGDYIDYNERIRDSVLENIVALYSSPDDTCSLFEESESYGEFLIGAADAVYECMLEKLKVVYENR